MAAAGERHLRRTAPSAPATGFTNYEARKPPVNSQNLPLLLKQNFKRLATPLQPPRTPIAHPSPQYGYFPQTFDFFSPNLAMRYPTANPQIRSHCKGIFNRLASPSFCNSPDAACSAHSGNRQNTGVFPKSPILFPKPCDAAQRAQGAQRTDGANAPCERLPPPIFLFPPQRETNLPRKVCHNTREVSAAGFGLLKNPQRPKRGVRRRRQWSADTQYRGE